MYIGFTLTLQAGSHCRACQCDQHTNEACLQHRASLPCCTQLPTSKLCQADCIAGIAQRVTGVMLKWFKLAVARQAHHITRLVIKQKGGTISPSWPAAYQAAMPVRHGHLFCRDGVGSSSSQSSLDSFAEISAALQPQRRESLQSASLLTQLPDHAQASTGQLQSGVPQHLTHGGDPAQPAQQHSAAQRDSESLSGGSSQQSVASAQQRDPHRYDDVTSGITGHTSVPQSNSPMQLSRPCGCIVQPCHVCSSPDAISPDAI